MQCQMRAKISCKASMSPLAVSSTPAGPIAGKVRRTDPAFAALVRNDNPEIVFKDEGSTPRRIG